MLEGGGVMGVPLGPQPPSPSRRGRPRKVNALVQDQALRLYFINRLSMREVAKVLGLSHMTVYRLLSDPNVEVLL